MGARIEVMTKSKFVDEDFPGIFEQDGVKYAVGRGETQEEAVQIANFAADRIEGCGSVEDVIDDTDIGGPALARGAAKNYHHVGCIVDPNDYVPVASEIAANGGLTLERRRGLALKVFERTHEYDGAIAQFMRGE